jgi:hypothetical protein
MDMAGVIVCIYKASISEQFKISLVPLFAETLMALKKEDEYCILNAACFFCDMLEYGS